MGLTVVLDLTGDLLQYTQNLVVALLYRAESLRDVTMRRIKDRATALAEMRPLQQMRELPDQIQQVLKELQELSKILLQLVINSTPLYKLVSPERIRTLRRAGLCSSCADEFNQTVNAWADLELIDL